MMIPRTACLLLVSALLMTGCSPKALTDGAAPAGETSSAAFMGSWKVTGHIVAPWFQGPGFDPEPDPEILEKSLVLAEASATGPSSITCEKAAYEVASLPTEDLFEGNAPDKYTAKAALGVEQDQTPTLTVSCVSEANDLTFNYHLIGTDKLLLGLNNIVYQFSRDTPTN